MKALPQLVLLDPYSMLGSTELREPISMGVSLELPLSRDTNFYLGPRAMD